jgi:hypothetical protein
MLSIIPILPDCQTFSGCEYPFLHALFYKNGCTMGINGGYTAGIGYSLALHITASIALHSFTAVQLARFRQTTMNRLP